MGCQGLNKGNTDAASCATVLLFRRPTPANEDGFLLQWVWFLAGGAQRMRRHCYGHQQRMEEATRQMASDLTGPDR